jgi:uncharacterized protein (UPF0276 family)
MRPQHEATPIPKLGVGVVWWPDLDPLCRAGEGLVQCIEAEPETFWIAGAGFTSRLAGALAHLPQPKLLHGVGAPFGGSMPQTSAHRAALAGDIAAVRPAWISDHLSFNQFAAAGSRAVCTGFFLPPAQSAEGVAQAATHIRQRRAALGVPVAFENAVNYLPPAPGEMTDGAFTRAVAEAADCGMVLDLHNVLCNARNGRQSVQEFLSEIPLERVWEIHLAGGEMERGFWLDAHTGLVEPALMACLADLVPRLPCLGAINFEIMPDAVAAIGLPAIADMLGKINDIWNAPRYAAAAPAEAAAAPPEDACAIPPALWESALGASLTGLPRPAVPPAFAQWLQAAQAPLDLYTFLAEENRASALVATAPRTIRLLLTALGERATRALLAQFWRHATPSYTAAEEASAFLAFIKRTSLSIPGLNAAVRSDRTGA